MSDNMVYSIPMMQQINAFFEKFADALARFDTKTMSLLYNSPCTLLSDDTTTVFNDPTKLEGFFNRGASLYKQIGVANIRHEIWSKHQWTDRMIIAKVNWRYSDILNNLLYNCDYQYILKADKNDQLKIIMSVSINEKERLAAWKDSLSVTQ